MELIVVIAAAALAGACAAPLTARVSQRITGWSLAALLAGLAIAIARAAPSADGGEPASLAISWAPQLGLTLSLRMDGLAAFFAVLIAAVGALVFIYATTYLRGHRHFGRFMAMLTLFGIAMLGIVLADNLLFLYVCWEVTTLSSWMLIGFDHEKEKARQSAWQALMVTSGGGLAMLAGFVLLGQMTGTYSISSILESGDVVRESALYVPVLVLILAGAATKSALVPFHFWLPNAMAAPTPVSAYLHSAAMVKAGVFLLARLSPALAETTVWTISVTAIGALTAMVAAWMALMQTDMKRLLAYTTISTIGLMTLMLGVGGEHAVRAGLTLLLAHALYKGALFMIAGCVDRGAGSRTIDDVGGLARVMPLSAAAAALALLSMVALPPTLGFLGEEEVLKSLKNEGGALSQMWLVATLLAVTLYTAAGLVVVLRPFLGRHRAPKQAHEVPLGMWLPALVLGAAGVVLACVPGWIDGMLVAPATVAVAGSSPPEALKLWHGFSTTTLLGLLRFALGVGLFALWMPLLVSARRLSAISSLGPDQLYDTMEQGLKRLAAWVDRSLQHGYLPAYLLIVATTALVISSVPLLGGELRIVQTTSTLHLYDVLVLVLLLVAAGGAIWSQSRVAVIACLSVVGYGAALIYAIFGGPDLAMTQVLVETLLVVLIVLLLPAMPRFEELEKWPRRLVDAVVCVLFGALVTLLLLTATGDAPDGQIAEYYRSHAESLAHSENMVNAILVNFRAIDTLGESSVLGAAALGVAILMFTSHRKKAARERETGAGGMPLQSLVLTLAAVALMPLLIVYALYLLVAGHSMPGGGFAAALVLAAALAIYLAGSPRGAEQELLQLAPVSLLGAGLLIMIAAGVIGLLSNDTFLTAQWVPAKLAIIGGLKPGTPLLFDLGICLISAGALFLMLRTLERRGAWN